MKIHDRRNLHVTEMKYLLSICGVTNMAKCGNKDVRRRVGVIEKI